MQTFMGIDLSLTGSACAFLGETYDWQLIQTKPREYVDHWHRYDHIAEEVCKMINDRKPIFIVVEDYICNPYNVRTTMALIEMGAIVRSRINATGHQWMTVVGSQLKKYVTGSGKGHKSLIMKDVYKNLNIDVDDDNVADAIVLATIAKDMYEYCRDGTLPRLKYRVEVLKKIASREMFNRPNASQCILGGTCGNE